MDPPPPPPPLPLPTLQEYRLSSSDNNTNDGPRMTDSHTPTLYIPIAAPLTPLPSPKPTAAPQLPLSPSSSGLGSSNSVTFPSASSSAPASTSGAGASDYPSLLPPLLRDYQHQHQQAQFSLDDALALFAALPASPSASSSPTSVQGFSTATCTTSQGGPEAYIQTPHRPTSQLPPPTSSFSSMSKASSSSPLAQIPPPPPPPLIPPRTTAPPHTTTTTTTTRRAFIAALLPLLTPAEMLFLSQRLAPLLKRDFLADLPAELGLLILSYVGAPGGGAGGSSPYQDQSIPSAPVGGTESERERERGAANMHVQQREVSLPAVPFSSTVHTHGGHAADPDVRSLVRAGMVSRRWRALARDEAVWRGMCLEAGFGREAEAEAARSRPGTRRRSREWGRGTMDEGGVYAGNGKGKARAREVGAESVWLSVPQMQHSLSTSSASSYASTSTSMGGSTRASSPAPDPEDPEEEEEEYEYADSSYDDGDYDKRHGMSASVSTIVPRPRTSISARLPAPLSLPLPQPDESPPDQPNIPTHSASASVSHLHPAPASTPAPNPAFSYRRHFRASWRVLAAWRRGGALLAQHRLDGAGGTSSGTMGVGGAAVPAGAAASALMRTRAGGAVGASRGAGTGAPTMATTATGTIAAAATATATHTAPTTQTPLTTQTPPAPTATTTIATVTSLALDGALVVVGLASSRVLLFSARTGVLVRTLRGHESGVWGVGLVSAPVGRGAPVVKGGAGKGGGAEAGLELVKSGKTRRRRRRRMEAPAQAQVWGLSDAMRRAVGVPVRGRGEEDGGLVLPGAVDFGDDRDLEEDEDSSGDEHDGYDGAVGAQDEYGQHEYADGTEAEEEEEEAAREAADRVYARARRAEAAQQPFDHTYSMPGWGPARCVAPVPVSGVPAPTGAEGVGDGEQDQELKRKRGMKTKVVKRGALVVSGGCDKVVKVWDAGSGQCIYTLTGHTSTVRALRLVPPVPGFSPFATASSSAPLPNSTNPATTAPPPVDSRSAPLALTGARDATIRVWDIRLGYCVRVLEGHTGSVRCLDVWCGAGEEALEGDESGATGDQPQPQSQPHSQAHQAHHRRRVRQRRCVSGSYDGTCRLWDLDTGECIHVLRGHFSQIYSVAFDGARVVSGGLDTTVRVWDAESGQCVALLQGHTALVCQLQLFRVPNASAAPGVFPPSPLPGSVAGAAADDVEYTTILATGGSDGRVITFSLATYTALHRIAAHDSSVTAMQLGGRFLVTAGNDGRVRLYEARGGGPPSYGHQESADAAHLQQSYHADAGPGSTSDGAGNSTAEAGNGGFAFSSMHDQRARDAERGSRLGVYRYVRDLSSAGETVWKAAFGRDTLVLAGRKGGRAVVEVWTMDPRNKMVRLKGKVKDRDL